MHLGFILLAKLQLTSLNLDLDLLNPFLNLPANQLAHLSNLLRNLRMHLSIIHLLLTDLLLQSFNHPL